MLRIHQTPYLSLTKKKFKNKKIQKRVEQIKTNFFLGHILGNQTTPIACLQNESLKKTHYFSNYTFSATKQTERGLTANKFLDESVAERCVPVQAEQNLGGEALEPASDLAAQSDGEEAPAVEEKWREATAWNCTASMAESE